MTGLLELGVLSAIGWGLLHFLWQGTVLTLITVLALRALSGASASVRYAIANVSLLSAPVILIITTARYARLETSAPSFPASLVPSDSRLVSVAAIVWLAGVTVLALRLAWSWRKTVRAGRLLPSLMPAGKPQYVEAAFERAKQRLRVTRKIRLACVAPGGSPAVFGWSRAVVLIPLSIATGLSPDQVEMLLAHEIAHVRRHDYLFNIIQSSIETLFFFHPGVWWISRQIRIERELACDEAVVDAYGRAEDYGEALARLALLTPAPAPAVGATSSPLQLRLRRLFGVVEPRDLIMPRWLPALALPGVLIAMLAGGQLAFAQSAVRGMIDGGSGTPSLRVIGRHEHHNTKWSRSVLVSLAAPDGGVVNELRLGRGFKGVRYRARLEPDSSGDSTVAELQAQVFGWRGSHTVNLIPRDSRVVSAFEADSMLLTFVRESGLNAESRAREIARGQGMDGVSQEVVAIGDPTVRAAYLRAGVREAATPRERSSLLAQALTIRNSPVEVRAVLVAALEESESVEELTDVVRAAPRVDGEAELVDVLVMAIRIARGGTPPFRSAVTDAAQSIQSDEARSIVMRELEATPPATGDGVPVVH